MRALMGTIVVGVVFMTGQAATLSAPREAPGIAQDASTGRPVYIVSYWRARPGELDAYSDYIRRVAEPIDEEARRAGVFDEVHTYTPGIRTGAEGADWTHVRIFKLRNFAAWDGFNAGLAAAGERLHPDPGERARTLGQSAELRDRIRQEIWHDFR